ncbi:MAG: universal stress protein [Rhodobacteraceae bacterium]|nr:universal stress protein [Paracoccaceae bacterium]
MSSCTVIAATDLSARSAHVAGRGASLARGLGARLILAHVASDEGGALPARFGALGLGRARDKPADLLTEIAQAHGAEPRLLQGAPDAALAGLAAQEGDVALIVLGLHRERGALDLLRLTTMERIVLAAPCPVLVAHQPPDRDYAQVLAPTDFTAASAAALIMAARIAPKARFHAIHALQLPIGAIFKRGNTETEAALKRAETLKAGFLAMPGLPPLAEPPEIVPGGVHQVLAFRREELAADLVCIGAHSGRKPDSLGNYARDLMRAPPTDLLVAKPG